MKYFLQIMLLVLGICCGCSKTSLLTPAQFTKEFADSLRESSAGLKVEIVMDLQLKVTTTNGHDSTVFVDNAYDMYKQNPQSKTDIIKHYVESCQEGFANPPSVTKIDPDRIVPIIKDRSWLADTRAGLLSRGMTNPIENVYEDFNRELIVLYAEDSPKNIRYFKPQDLDDLHIDRKDLRPLACKNLMRLLPEIKRYGTNGMYMLKADGNYETSLLLIDSIWTNLVKDVKGEIVVGVPTRDLLIVTGSGNYLGLKTTEQIVQKAFAEGSYRLTTNLFFYHSGAFYPFKDPFVVPH
ncbi:MAG TPA: DUF1444 family protein [Verrucomicrobiae bacterium]|nr:DUF1444 family protein [Verrucomicrobiae bacterium]